MPATTRGMRLEPASHEVLFAKGPVVTVDRALIESLKIKALANARQRMRLCTHQDLRDSVQEMLVVHTRNTYVRPHKHRQEESFHVIEGRADIVLFDGGGAITDVIPAGEYGSGLMFYHRLANSAYHSLLIRSEVIVFHEAKAGPFAPGDNDFAPWSPELDDAAGQRVFLDRMAREAERILATAERHP